MTFPTAAAKRGYVPGFPQVFGNCNGGYYSFCVTLCYGYTDDYRTTLAAFWVADDEYWTDRIKRSSYLADMPGGPMTKMRAALARMRTIAANYNLNNCHNYLYG